MAPHGPWGWPRRLQVLWAWVLWPASAFDIDAHDAVGQTAQSALDQQAMKEVKRLLGGKDCSDVAGWGHQVDDTFPGITRIHFQVHDDTGRLDFCGPPEARTAKCEDTICLVNAIKHFYGKILLDEGRKIDYPKMNYNKAERGIRFSDADAVKMLINLIADLHQPMHVGFASDDMGRKVQVKFNGKVMSLYDFWDTGISNEVRSTESNFWLGGWTHVSGIRAEFDKDVEAWKKDGAFKSIDRWYEETVKFACETGYVHPVSGKKLAGPGAEEGPVEITQEAYQIWKQSWLRQVLLAGARTAIVLNDILDAKGASKLSERNGMKTKADIAEEKQKQEWAKEARQKRRSEPTRSSFSSSVFLTNLSIAVVTVPLFLVVVNFGLDPRAIAAAVKSLTSTDTGGQQSKTAKRFD